MDYLKDNTQNIPQDDNNHKETVLHKAQQVNCWDMWTIRSGPILFTRGQNVTFKLGFG